MMQALRAHGKTASLFMYPYEDHGPATRDSNLDQWARWVAWLDMYVKNAGQAPRPKQVTTTTPEQRQR
jgi:dipeptidyl aminopeptidase/acylaminoacyl peptidase